MLDIDPQELPCSDPLVKKQVVKRELGITSDATLFRHIRNGTIPKPDGQVMGVNVWRWSTILKAREQLLNMEAS